ncbi:NERD domain-containing protein [Streptomyces capillispiralis]|uniref:NERD domain-containing protein n=1 Tax=Streptomyces capillispiralis TaxID=68182 RepID=UPI00244DF7E2|nr:NERD domain-containing protein [Streptomyces capillispiralis]
MGRERWFQPRRSGHAWEQEGLDHIRQRMPKAESYRAWATFQFTGPSGRVNECDLLIAVPGGVYLLEPKGHPGRVVNHGDTWQFHHDRVRTLKNPLHLTDLKAKELKEQPARAARGMKEDPRRVPFIKLAVFLHAPGLVSDLDEFQQTGVYGRDGGGMGLPGIWDELLGLPPERESWRITPQTSALLEELMKRGAHGRGAALVGRPVFRGSAGTGRGTGGRVGCTAARVRRVRRLGHARRGPRLL